MTKLNRKVEYSLMALKYLHSQGAVKVTAKEVAEALHASFDVMARVMQIMAQRGLLTSEHGASGGYRLGPLLPQVSLFDLVEMIEGPTALVKCISDEHGCEIQSSCNIASPVKSLNDRLNRFFKEIPVKELVEGNAHV